MSMLRNLTITQTVSETRVMKRLEGGLLRGAGGGVGEMWRLGWCDDGELKECLFLKFCMGPKFQVKFFFSVPWKGHKLYSLLPLHLCMILVIYLMMVLV